MLRLGLDDMQGTELREMLSLPWSNEDSRAIKKIVSQWRKQAREGHNGAVCEEKRNFRPIGYKPRPQPGVTVSRQESGGENHKRKSS
jgi:hypothetical protein